MKQERKINKSTFFWVFTILILIVALVFTLEAVTSGAELSNLEKEEAALFSQNKDLSDSLIKSSSVLSYEEKLEELGFIKPEKILYITEKEVVAKLP